MKKIILVTALLIFGSVTVFMSSSVLFDWFGIRAKEGNFVPFIVWANWFCGLLYLAAAFAVFKNESRAKFPLFAALLILITAYAALFIYIKGGGEYETKTVGAMAFRIMITAVFLLITTKNFKK